MTLQSSGQITLLDIKNEFNAGGSSTNIKINDYYAGAATGYVPIGTGSIPSSGAISLFHFYGASKASNYLFTLGGDWSPGDD